jgi:hypothetical protein
MTVAPTNAFALMAYATSEAAWYKATSPYSFNVQPAFRTVLDVE